MVYAQTPFAACVRENGQVVCAGGIEDMIQGELESVNFKVKDIASNYFGTFLLNEAGGVVTFDSVILPDGSFDPAQAEVLMLKGLV